MSVRVESVAEKVESRNSAKGKNGIEVTNNKQLNIELPERKSSETRSDILGDPPTLRKSSKEGELTANRKSHERKVHDSEALKKAKETEALRKAKEEEREAVKKENDDRVKDEAVKVRKAAEELSERKRSLERVLEKENVVPTPNITTISSNTTDPIKSSENKKLLVGKNNSHVTNERFLDMEEPLPEPPPTPPKRSSSPIEISAPLIISTEPMSVSSSSSF